MSDRHSRQPTWDQNFARNFKRLREDMGLTQEQVVDSMAHFGFTFHQATIYKIEKGERKIGLGEAMALALSLDTTVEVLAEDGVMAKDAYYDSTLWQLTDNMFGLLRKMWDLTDEYNEQRHKLFLVLDGFLSPHPDTGVRQIDEVFPEQNDYWWKRIRDEFAPAFLSPVVHDVRSSLMQATSGPLQDAFTNISGFAEFEHWEPKPSDPALEAADKDSGKLEERWGL